MDQKKMKQVDQKRMKRFLKVTCFYMLFMAIMCNPNLAVFAATDTSAVENQFNTLQDLVAAIISSIGTIITLWGISEFGMAMQSNDGAGQSHSFKRIGGGLLMILAPQILTILT